MSDIFYKEQLSDAEKDALFEQTVREVALVQRMRDAAPEMYALLDGLLEAHDYGMRGIDIANEWRKLRALINGGENEH